MSLEHLFAVCLVSTLLSFGGTASLPVLRGQLSSMGPSADTLILNSLAVGYVAPGPNGLYLVAVAYFIGGIPGALVSVVAVVIPPLFVIVLDRVRERLTHLRRYQSTVKSLSYAVVAVMASSSGTLAVHASTTVLAGVMVGVGAILLLMRVPTALTVLGAIVVGLLVG
ncbi:MAG: chromate transporter [Micromonosporaceae bacterium]|jgi:chromate transporter|nr:chromate transporter [Micromonosporaceae bacterium]